MAAQTWSSSASCLICFLNSPLFLISLFQGVVPRRHRHKAALFFLCFPSSPLFLTPLFQGVISRRHRHGAALFFPLLSQLSPLSYLLTPECGSKAAQTWSSSASCSTCWAFLMNLYGQASLSSRRTCPSRRRYVA